MAEVTGILETALYADDLERTGAFYERLLGVEPMVAEARMRAYPLGSTVLLLFAKGATLDPAPTPGGTIPPHDGSGPVHLAFAIPAEALEAWTARLGELGIEVESRVTWPRGGTSLYFRDPEGRSVELAAPGLWANY
jgi:catechol 2,3-dioxygenase-like lactoylglutathione lyase family enzyme